MLTKLIYKINIKFIKILSMLFIFSIIWIGLLQTRIMCLVIHLSFKSSAGLQYFTAKFHYILVITFKVFHYKSFQSVINDYFHKKNIPYLQISQYLIRICGPNSNFVNTWTDYKNSATNFIPIINEFITSDGQ
jgi:hypothetical protein